MAHTGVGLSPVERQVDDVARAVVDGDGGVILEGADLEIDVLEVGVGGAIQLVQVFSDGYGVSVGVGVGLAGVDLPRAADPGLTTGPHGVDQVDGAAAADDTIAPIVAHVSGIAGVDRHVAGDRVGSGDVLVAGEVDLVAGHQDVGAFAEDEGRALPGFEQVCFVTVLPVIVVDDLVIGGGDEADG